MIADEPTGRPSRHYTNHVNVYAGPFDVVIEAGEKTAPNEDLRLTCALVMSPQMAKVVSQLLATTIQQWEANHGEIALRGQITRGGPIVPN